MKTVLAAVVASITLGLMPVQAEAAPNTPSFGAQIDPYSSYDGQKTCESSAKAGPIGVRDLLNTTYGTHTAGIVRNCDGSVSEHHEGRALDYHFNYFDTADRAKAEDFLSWLLATDQHGNAHAMARRLGVMYVIWNNRIWEAYRPGSGWTPYSGDSPHQDHIHISFSWAGAYKQTSWWTQAAQQIGRIGVLQGGTLSVKEGNLYAGWVPQLGNVAKFEIDGDRIGVLTTGGEVLVKEGDLYAGWTTQLGGAKDFHLAGDRIGVLRNDGSLAVKDGSLYAGWTEQAGNVADFDMTPNRIGAVFTDGLASVKEGDLYAGWVNQMGGVKDIELAGGRLGVLRTDNSLAVKDGSLYASWTEQAGGITSFEMTTNRIGAVFGNGIASVKEGDLYAGWVNQMGSTREIDLSADRIGVVRNDGSLAVKEGSLYAAWTEQASPITSADLTHR
ncbi:hypothetical protein FKR81_08815 [Lentzea tibetensis]|uniref:ARB-07466-like C-terminal domain-containing protein n=1 Tax=Lentzea tibetensis TaxID=2591470 RepID=A0A563EXP3_9PSEU|nr:hypothetical protein [Lentzea tibetensis]TWP52429.1 hypothetical protein FKR81_08815 [Lentzea tibetensis]